MIISVHFLTTSCVWHTDRLVRALVSQQGPAVAVLLFSLCVCGFLQLPSTDDQAVHQSGEWTEEQICLYVPSQDGRRRSGDCLGLPVFDTQFAALLKRSLQCEQLWDEDTDKTLRLFYHHQPEQKKKKGTQNTRSTSVSVWTWMIKSRNAVLWDQTVVTSNCWRMLYSWRAADYQTAINMLGYHSDRGRRKNVSEIFSTPFLFIYIYLYIYIYVCVCTVVWL